MTVWFRRIALLAALLTFVVVVLGAFVRLTNAGLGCPDWPGCYGQLIGVPEDVATRQAMAESTYGAEFPGYRIDPIKGWKEMVHRYAAGILGLLILAMAVLAWPASRRDPAIPVGIAIGALAGVIFQSVLGMWTVTLLLKPFVVTAHLLGGMTILALLAWAVLRSTRLAPSAVTSLGVSGQGARLRPWAFLALAVVTLQIALGGWTSTNYAALACPDFPTCQGQWLPPMNFGEAFVLWRGLGIDYEGGVLDHPARTAIQMTHRLWAVAVTLVVGALALRLLFGSGPRALRFAGGALAVALLAQLGLGMANVWLSLPLWVATAHNGGAAVLVVTLMTIIHLTSPLPAPVTTPPVDHRRQGASNAREADRQYA